MNKQVLTKLLIGLFSTIGVIYILFLLLPVITIPFVDGITKTISAEIEKSLGFKAEINKLRIVTTPKLTVGAKLEGLKIFQPDSKLMLSGDNFQFKMSLLPLFTRRIEADLVSADDLTVDLYVKKDGHFVLEDFFKAETPSAQTVEKPTEAQVAELPFGLKLSNHLPDFRLKKHNISFIDSTTGKKYSLEGSNTSVTDFIVNKKVKIKSEGKLVLDGFNAFSYNVKLFNKIMPDLDLNQAVFEPSDDNDAKPVSSDIDFNIIDAFKLMKTYGFTANLLADVTISGNFEDYNLDGKINLDKLSMIVNGKKLPDSSVVINFDKNKHAFDSNLYTAQLENTQVSGFIKSGKTPSVDLTCKSNATLKSIFDIVKTFAQIAGMNDLKTLSADGKLDANFNIKSDFKKLSSNGYLKLLNGNIAYGLYDVKINDLVSDIVLDNNSVLINKLGFSTYSVPFNVTGKIKPDTTADINIETNNLSLKGLLVSLGQASLLKENPVNSGTVTVKANVSDKLTEPKITGRVLLNNLNIKNIPSDVTLTVNPVDVQLKSTKNGFEGSIEAGGIKAINPVATVSALSAKALINEKEINLQDTKVFIDKNETVVSGKISDYMTDKIGLKFETKGKIASNLTGDVNPVKMLLDLKYTIPNDALVIIPGFDKSQLKVNGNVSITGSMMNPILKGQFKMPSIEIPEVPVSIKNMTANIDGEILNGNAILEHFASGGIQASSVKTDYKLVGNDFYLKNLSGNAFDGTFDGDILYNLSTAKCKVKFNGKNMSALKAIEGAAGIKNALTGNLGFVADVNFQGVEYDDMMKSLKGNVQFDIKDGTLGNLGSLKSILNAQNLLQNTFLKTAVSSSIKLPAVETSSQFDYITGNMSFNNAYAQLNSIKMSGPSMAYYITGQYNLLNGTTNAVVLGRLSSNIVGALGNIGDLSTQKLTSLVPGLGSLTSSLLKSMNESPKNVKTEEIPSLRSAETAYKDFKVVYNGGIESTSSVKSFKWLNDVDTSVLDAQPSAANVVSDVKSTVQNTVSDVKATATQAKEQAKEQAKVLLKSLLTVPSAEGN